MVLDNTKNIGYILYGLNSKVNNYNKKCQRYMEMKLYILIAM
jgi:hypothetical protein